MHTIIEDGDSLQIRATISDAKELGELIAKLESRRSGWTAKEAVKTYFDTPSIFESTPSDGAIYSVVNRSMFSKEQNAAFDAEMDLKRPKFVSEE